MSVNEVAAKEMEVPVQGQETQPAPALTVFASVAGILAAWLAAESAGLFAHPLRITLTWLALLVAAVCAWPARGRLFFVACVAVVAGLPFFLPTGPVQDTLLVAVFLAALAAGHANPAKRILLICANAVFTLALFRLACAAIPWVWLQSNAASHVLGSCAAWITGRPLDIGPTFAGMDFLVLMIAYAVGWLWGVEGARWKHALYAASAIFAVHLLYLFLLSFTADLIDSLPTPPAPVFKPPPYVEPDWSWAKALRQPLPWNMPALAALLHIGVIVALLRWSAWPVRNNEPSALVKPPKSRKTSHVVGPAPTKRWIGWAMCYGPLLLALLLPVSVKLTISRSDLTGKRIVANRHGLLDWRRPSHNSYGRQSAGEYGMLPVLVESLGGRFAVSEEFSSEDLKDADLVVWLHPSGQVPQGQYERIWDFVQHGGSLLVVAGPLLGDSGRGSSCNEILKPTDMHVREEVAISPTGNWQHACQPFAHPATSAMCGNRNTFFTDFGTSIEIKSPARPLLVGRWGWSEPGSDAVLANVVRWEGGERLGDLVLAAEQSCGQGTVVVAGDGFSLTNEGSVRGYEWTGRLLSYLVNRPQSPQQLWRQLASLILVITLLVLVCCRLVNAERGRMSAQEACGAPTLRSLALAHSGAVIWPALLLSVSLGICTQQSLDASRVVPDGRRIEAALPKNYIATQLAVSTGHPLTKLLWCADYSWGKPYRLAYIDASHLEAFCDKNWVFDSINGLALTLMRNGYLVAAMPEVTQDRLERADIVVSIAPRVHSQRRNDRICMDSCKREGS